MALVCKYSAMGMAALVFALSVNAAKADFDIGTFACSGPVLQNWDSGRLAIAEVESLYPDLPERPVDSFNLLWNENTKSFEWTEDREPELSASCVFDFETENTPIPGLWRQIGPFSLTNASCDVPPFSEILGSFPRQLLLEARLHPLDVIDPALTDWEFERDQQDVYWIAMSKDLPDRLAGIRNLVVSFPVVRPDFIELEVFVGAFGDGCEDSYRVTLYRDGT